MGRPVVPIAQIARRLPELGRIKDGVKVPEGFEYASNTNAAWMSIDELRAWVTANEAKIGAI